MSEKKIVMSENRITITNGSNTDIIDESTMNTIIDSTSLVSYNIASANSVLKARVIQAETELANKEESINKSTTDIATLINLITNATSIEDLKSQVQGASFNANNTNNG